MMTICGSPQARTGSVIFDGRDITRMPTHEIARLRIAQSPEGRRIFPRMTVYENLQMGASLDNLKHFNEDVEKIFTLFPRLKERQAQRGGTLSGGEQQMLSIGRALMARPKLLLLDEPSLGLAPLIVKGIFEAIKKLNKTGGADRLPRRAERLRRAEAFRPRLCHGQRPGDDERLAARNCSPIRKCAPPISKAVTIEPRSAENLICRDFSSKAIPAGASSFVRLSFSCGFWTAWRTGKSVAEQLELLSAGRHLYLAVGLGVAIPASCAVQRHDVRPLHTISSTSFFC